LLTSIGTLRFRNEGNDFWLTLDCDPELGKYLRWLYKMFTFGVGHLQAPSRMSHITVVSRREKYRISKRVGFWNGQSVKFVIILKPETNGNAVWMPVTSEQLFDLRQELGLERIPGVALHYCVGYLYSGKRRCME
jgi:hypothetical protein